MAAETVQDLLTWSNVRLAEIGQDLKIWLDAKLVENQARSACNIMANW